MESLILPHTALSLLALVAGWFVIARLLARPATGFWVVLFLITAVLTSATGFLLPAPKLLPSHVVGIVALVVLAVVLVARFYALEGAWRWIDAIGLVASQYLLMFVLVAQGFGKVAALHALAPTLQEPPFAIAQAVLFAAFAALGWLAARRAASVSPTLFRG